MSLSQPGRCRPTPAVPPDALPGCLWWTVFQTPLTSVVMRLPWPHSSVMTVISGPSGQRPPCVVSAMCFVEETLSEGFSQGLGVLCPQADKLQAEPPPPKSVAVPYTPSPGSQPGGTGGRPHAPYACSLPGRKCLQRFPSTHRAWMSVMAPIESMFSIRQVH